jgi:hypothetical protein
MKHLIITGTPYVDNLHRVVGTYNQDMRPSRPVVQANGQDLIDLSDDQFDMVAANVLAIGDYVWVWDSEYSELVQVTNPDPEWPYTE